MRSQGIAIQWTPETGPRRRISFEPTDDGGILRVEETWTGCEWSEDGCEPVEDVETEGEIVDLGVSADE